MATAPSPARQLANTANARQSTGPRTDPGKARSSQNARTHGLTAKHLNLAEDEREEFEQFLAEYRAASQPQGPIQETLFHEMVLAAWNLRRIGRMETALYAQAPDPLALTQNEDLFRKLERLQTYRSRILSVYARSLRELRALQTSLGHDGHAAPGNCWNHAASRLRDASHKTNPTHYPPRRIQRFSGLRSRRYRPLCSSACRSAFRRTRKTARYRGFFGA